jgi:tRNA (guanine37-N1)-methyltransferase
MTESWCAFVKRRNGEKLRRWLIKNGLLDTGVKVQSENDWLIFPLKRELNEEEESELIQSLENIRFERRSIELNVIKKPKDLFSALGNSIPEKLHEFIPRSFDTVGDIVIIEIPEEIIEFERLIGKTILDMHPSLISVFKKTEPITGEFRLRNVELLAGINKTETIYRENKCKFELDIKKVYFSPRLVTEHARVCSLVKKSEKVLDMFTGIGPFSILIAKQKQAQIYAVDINPDAIYYLKKNIVLNKVENFISPLEGDIREVINQISEQRFDRIIMNLPSKASEFLDVALKVLNSEGVIHFYEFVSESDFPEKSLSNLRSKIEQNDRVINEILQIRKVRPYAPYIWHVGIDFTVQPSDYL